MLFLFCVEFLHKSTIFDNDGLICGANVPHSVFEGEKNATYCRIKMI